MSWNDLYVLLPMLVVIAWALVLLLVDLWIPRGNKGITAGLAAIGMAAALGLTLSQRGQSLEGFGGMAVLDSFSVYMNVIILVSGLAAVALALDYLKKMEIERGEYYVLLMISVSGMMLMTQAHDLIMVFLALEMLSMPLYVLAGFDSNRFASGEAALKYFLLGAFTSGFLLYGVALIFGATSYTSFSGIIQSVQAGTVNMPLFVVGVGLVLAAFGFKVAAVPFQMWTPDVYQGAPSPVTAFMSVGVKAAAFAALMRVFLALFPSLAANLAPILAVLSALTMIVGNVVAILQTNIKRLLAFSSIANAGYLLMAFVSYGNSGISSQVVGSMLFFLVAYALTSLGAWSVVTAMEKQGGGLDLEDYAGLGRKAPWLALPMVVFMLSFTGMPLTMGFWGKFYLFKTAIDSGYLWLAIVGLITSVVSAFYYLKVVMMMYMKPGEPEIARQTWSTVLAVGLAVVVILLAFLPGSLLETAAQAFLRI